MDTGFVYGNHIQLHSWLRLAYAAQFMMNCCFGRVGVGAQVDY